jgi:hypothetical protein
VRTPSDDRTEEKFSMVKETLKRNELLTFWLSWVTALIGVSDLCGSMPAKCHEFTDQFFRLLRTFLFSVHIQLKYVNQTGTQHERCTVSSFEVYILIFLPCTLETPPATRFA